MARPALTKSKSGVGVPVDVTAFPSNLVEASTFFAGPVPQEVKATVELFHSIPLEHITELISIASRYLSNDVSHFALVAGLYDKYSSPGIANALLTAVYLILRTSLRNKAKISIIKKDLLSMHLPAGVVDAFCAEMVRSRAALETAMVHEKRIHFPKLEKVRWRIDVAISSGSLSRVMRPNILMQIVTKDGTVSTFEVGLEQFNQLRYSVAKVLNDMNTTERHPIIRIVNEFRRREEEDYNH